MGGEETKVIRDFCPLSERPPLGGESAGLVLPARNEWAASLLGLSIGAAAEEEEDRARSRPERTRGTSKLIATTASGPIGNYLLLPALSASVMSE